MEKESVYDLNILTLRVTYNMYMLPFNIPQYRNIEVFFLYLFVGKDVSDLKPSLEVCQLVIQSDEFGVEFQILSCQF